MKTIVSLKKELDDDRHPIDKKLRAGQLGLLIARREMGDNGDWWWVQWYSDEPAQSHTLDEVEEFIHDKHL